MISLQLDNKYLSSAGQKKIVFSRDITISLKLGNNDSYVWWQRFPSIGQQWFLVCWATMISHSLGNKDFSSVGLQWFLFNQATMMCPMIFLWFWSRKTQFFLSRADVSRKKVWNMIFLILIIEKGDRGQKRWRWLSDIEGHKGSKTSPLEAKEDNGRAANQDTPSFSQTIYIIIIIVIIIIIIIIIVVIIIIIIITIIRFSLSGRGRSSSTFGFCAAWAWSKQSFHSWRQVWSSWWQSLWLSWQVWWCWWWWQSMYNRNISSVFLCVLLLRAPQSNASWL